MFRHAAICAMLLLAGCASITGGPLDGHDPIAAARGRAFAQANCAACHAVGAARQSPNPKAPPFGDIHARYTPAILLSELEVSAIAGHYDMPPLSTTAAERADVVAYVMTLK